MRSRVVLPLPLSPSIRASSPAHSSKSSGANTGSSWRWKLKARASSRGTAGLAAVIASIVRNAEGACPCGVLPLSRSVQPAQPTATPGLAVNVGPLVLMPGQLVQCAGVGADNEQARFAPVCSDSDRRADHDGTRQRTQRFNQPALCRAIVAPVAEARPGVPCSD